MQAPSISARPGRPQWRRWGKPGPRAAMSCPSAFPALRPGAPHRLPRARGKFALLSSSERRQALRLVTRDAYAATSRGPNKSKHRTIQKYLACFGLTLLPFTARVVRALGAALKWRKYRSADQYLYAARAIAERRGAVPSLSTLRALKDTIRSCRRGIGLCECKLTIIIIITPISISRMLPGSPRVRLCVWFDARYG